MVTANDLLLFIWLHSSHIVVAQFENILNLHA